MSKKNKKKEIEQEELDIMETNEEIYEDTVIEEVFENPKQAKKAKKEKAKKEKGKNFFGKKNKGDFVEEDDLYYGIQIKPFEELRKGYDIDEDELKQDTMENTYARLFDDTITSLDDEIEENFRKIQQERRKRVALAVESAGVDVDKVADELGIIAPMPVTAKKEELKSIEAFENTAEFAKAISETANTNTMEIKLNIVNNTLELADNKVSVVDEETIESINKLAKEVSEKTEEIAPDETLEKEKDCETDSENEADFEIKVSEENEISFPTVENESSYREKILPVHFLNIDVMQSALVSEAQVYGEVKVKDDKKNSPFSRFAFEDDGLENENGASFESDEEIDDYVSKEDAKPIFEDMKNTLKKLSMRAGISFVCLLVLIIASFGFGNNQDEGATIAYLIISLIFAGLLIAVNFKSLLSGFKNLLSFKANSDSAAAVASFAVVMQIVAGFFNTQLVSNENVSIYTPALALVLFLNVLGKTVMVKRIHGNFRFLTSREMKYAVRSFGDHNTALKLAKNTSVSAPSIAYQQKAGFLKRFLQLSYKSDPAEQAGEFFAPWTLVLALVFAVVALLITGNMLAGINTLAATLLISTPASNLLCLNLPISRFCRKLNRAGAMTVGFEGIKTASNINSIMIDAHDLFPLGTVTLEGVKTFSERNSENDIFLAGAVANMAGGITADIFRQVNDEAEYGEAEAFKCIPECGFEGIVEGKKILIGNHGILVENGITPPEKDEVMKFTQSDEKSVKKVLFVAVDNELSCMLIVNYKADSRKKREIKALEKNGIALIVNQSDVNITQKLISRLFGMNEGYISVISGDLTKVYENTANAEVTRADALIATKGRVESLMKVISYANEIKPVLTTLVIVENISVVLALLIAVLFTFFAPLTQISTFAIIFFYLFWLLCMFIIPKFKLKVK